MCIKDKEEKICLDLVDIMAALEAPEDIAEGLEAPDLAAVITARLWAVVCTTTPWAAVCGTARPGAAAAAAACSL